MINDDMKTRESLSVFDEKGTEMADALMAGFLKIKEIPIEGHSKDKRVKAISRDNEIIRTGRMLWDQNITRTPRKLRSQ